MNIEPRRPLNDDERRVLTQLLARDFTDVERLRAQADRARVAGRCDCGCPTINLEVPGNMPPATLPGPLAPVELWVSPEGGEPPGEIILFLEGGRLSSMEYVYYSDKPPDRWPAADRLTAVEIRR